MQICSLDQGCEFGRVGSSTGLPVTKHELRLADDLLSISTTGCPAFDSSLGGQIQDFALGIVICKGGLVLGNLLELAVESFDDISCTITIS